MHYEVVPCDGGSFTLKDRRNGQTMHSKIGPWQEALAVYVEQSPWEELLRESAKPLILFDVGMGLAANALAAADRIGQLRARGLSRPVEIVSFETDPEGLRFGLRERRHFPFLTDEVATLLERGSVELPGAVRWRWLEGSLLERLSAVPRASLIYFDLYSPAVCPELWDEESFRSLAARSEPGARLITYSAAGHVRRALRASGFQPRTGASTPMKRETTVADLET